MVAQVTTLPLGNLKTPPMVGIPTRRDPRRAKTRASYVSVLTVVDYDTHGIQRYRWQSETAPMLGTSLRPEAGLRLAPVILLWST